MKKNYPKLSWVNNLNLLI